MKPEAKICLCCIGDEALRQLVRESATRMRCSFCKNRRLGVALKILAEEIDAVYRENYKPGDWYSTVGLGDDDKTYRHQQGESPEDIIQEKAGVEPEVADAIIKILADKEAHHVRDGADAYYEISERYVETDFFPVEQYWAWQEFYQGIKHHRRYFDDDARLKLHSGH